MGRRALGAAKDRQDAAHRPLGIGLEGRTLRSVIVTATSVLSLTARRFRIGVFVALLAACATTAIVAPGASALSKIGREASRFGAVSDRAEPTGVKVASSSRSLQHSTLFGHLPPVRQDLELVGKLNLISPSTQKPVLPGQVADVAVHKGYAYLNSWDSTTCEGGGTFVVDIRTPAQPRQVAFIPAQPPFYHGEGAQVLSIDTPQFKGDVLAVNDETYGSNVTAPCGPTDRTGGGFDLYNVTDPTRPVALVQGAGDRSPYSSEIQDPTLVGNSYHSVFAWQDGPRAYLVASDNIEVSDVDIFDITDPARPEFIKDLDVLELPEASKIVGQSAHGNQILHHDVVVKRIDGHMRMLVSYWDAGYVQLNVDNPANPTYITDTSFDAPDRLTSVAPPEGNAHQAEYSYDNQFILAADEDFDPYRLVSKITQAPFAGAQFSPAVSDAEPIAPGATIAGDTAFVGAACTGTVPPPPPGVTIAVAERGVCPGGFQEKADAIEGAGYDMGVIFNSSFGGPPAGGRCETLINMAIDPPTVHIPMVFVGRADGLRILGVFNESTYQCTGAEAATPADTPAPPLSSAGLTLEFTSVYDGWGYAHLYDANTSQEIGAFAIPQSLDARYASGFGDLSIHEVAADPQTNLAYVSYYSGGLRVLRFSRAAGLEEVGRFIDEGGSNFWGVEQFTDKDGNRLIAGSDRDYGLYIVKYIGPGAVLAKPPPAAAPPGASAAPPASSAKRPSSFFGFGSLKRLLIGGRRASVTISVPGPGKASADLKARIGRRVIQIARATGTAKRAGRLRLTFRLSVSAQRLLRRTLARRATRRTSGVVRVSFTPTGGTKRTRNRALSIGMR